MQSAFFADLPFQRGSVEVEVRQARHQAAAVVADDQHDCLKLGQGKPNKRNRTNDIIPLGSFVAEPIVAISI